MAKRDTITALTPKHGLELSAMIRRNIDAMIAPNYTERETEVWKLYYSPERVRDLLGKAELFGVWQRGTLIGSAGLMGVVLICLYVHPDHLGQGVGRRLLQFIEDHARAQDMAVLELHANPFALDFYTDHGYECVKPVTFRFMDLDYPENLMRKRLS